MKKGLTIVVIGAILVLASIYKPLAGMQQPGLLIIFVGVGVLLRATQYKLEKPTESEKEEKP